MDNTYSILICFKRTIILLVSISYFCSTLFAQQNLTLVSEYGGAIPIITKPKFPPRTKDCVNELADYIEKISGKRPEILFKVPNPIPKKAIWVGIHPELQIIFPNDDFTFSNPEEVLIKSNSNHLVIAGRDVWTQEGLQGKIVNLTKNTNLQEEYGTCHAIYTFLEKSLGVSWLWPGEFGIYTPDNKDISIEPISYNYFPKIQFRNNVISQSFLGKGNYMSGEIKWGIRNCLSYSSLYYPKSAHGFSDWWNKYHEEYPEIFALQENGKRDLSSIVTKNPNSVKLCVSNPKIIDLWLDNVEQQLALDPNQKFFAAGTNDGYTKGHCTCSKCASWDVLPLDGKEKNLADREVKLGNELSIALKNKYPDKNYYVAILSYGWSLSPPLREIPNENVLIIGVHNFHNRRSYNTPIDSNGLANQYKQWDSLGATLVWRPNIGTPCGWRWGMPDISIKQCAEDMKYVSATNTIGVRLDLIYGHWATQGPQYYLIGKLAYDPSISADSLMDDYMNKAYGPAKKELTKYWEFVNISRREFYEKYQDKGKKRHFHIHEFYTKDWFDEAYKHVNAGLEKTTSNASDRQYENRILFTKAGIDYIYLLCEIRAATAEFEEKPSKKQYNKIERLWMCMNEFKLSAPQYAIKFIYLFKAPFGSDQTRFMKGLYPKKNPHVLGLDKEEKQGL